MSYESDIFEILTSVKNQIRAMPLLLGGVTASGGGGGGPPGGFIGRLPQTRVAYDLSELALPTTPTSGASLLDNLNHIRYRLAELESNPTSPLVVEDTEIVVSSGVVVLNFEGFTVTDDGDGQVTITTSGGTTSLEIQQDDSTIATAVNTINFEGATVTDDSNGKVTVNITVSGSIPSSFEVQKDDITVATDIDTLNFEGVTVTDDGSGKVTITVTASGDMFKSIYDTDDDGIVDSAETVEWLGVLNAPAFALSGHTHTLSSLDDVNIPSPEDSQFLSYNAGTEKWELVTLSGNTGASTFLDLSDTPDAYTGQAGKSVVVNSTETGLEFTTISGGSSTGLLTPPYKEDYTISATTASGHFDTTYQYISNALELYYNGVKVLAGDYTIDEDYQGFSLDFTTYSGDYVEALYYTTSGNLISGAVPEYLERMAVFTVKGTLAVETGLLRVYNETDVDLTITDAVASVGVAPSSSITQLDIKKNGISIMTSPLEVGDGQYKSYTASGLSATTWAVGEYLTVDIIQTGNAEDLTVQVVGLEDASVAQVINANMLEGKHSDDFAIAGHTHPAFELTVEDEDQEISVDNVSKIVFPENMVVDGGNGIVNITLDELPTYALTVETQDQSPVVLNVDRIKVPNGSLTDEGGGVVSLDLTVGITDFYAFHTSISGEFLALTEKTTPVANDLLVIEDSADTYSKKYVKVSNLPGGGLTWDQKFLEQFAAITDWTSREGTWAVSSGVLSQTDKTKSNAFLEYTGTTYTGINSLFTAMKASIRYPSSGAAWPARVGFCLCHLSGAGIRSGEVTVWLRRNSDATLTIEYDLFGTGGSSFLTSASVAADTWLTFAVYKNDFMYKCYVDGSYVGAFSRTDTSWTANTCGLSMRTAIADYDDVYFWTGTNGDLPW